jgi:hypothetical protein
MTVRFLFKNKRSWLYRRQVPRDIRDKIGKREWKISLDRRLSETAAAAKAEDLADEHDKLIRAMRTGAPVAQHVPDMIEALGKALRDRGADVVKEELANKRDAAVADHLNQGGKSSSAKGATLDDYNNTLLTVARGGDLPDRRDLKSVYAADVKNYGGGRSEKPIREAVKLWTDLVGNTDFITVKRADVEKFVAACRKLGHSDASIKRRIGALQAISNRARMVRDMTESSMAWRKLNLKTGNPAAKRLGFHRWHLGLIDSFLASSARTKPATKRLVRVMRGLGLGPAEALGLRPEDVDLKSDPPTLFVRETDDRKLKTGAIRERLLPLTGDTLEAIKDGGR